MKMSVKIIHNEFLRDDQLITGYSDERKEAKSMVNSSTEGLTKMIG